MRGINQKVGTDIYTLPNIEQMGNEDLLYSTGNCVQSLGLGHDGRKYEKKEWLGRFAVQQKLTEQCKSTVLEKIKITKK